jgi:hypothetical protein
LVTFSRIEEVQRSHTHPGLQWIFLQEAEEGTLSIFGANQHHMETLLTAIPGCKALDKAASLQDTFELS